MISCPICHARLQADDKINGSCNRCKNDLQELFHIEQESHQWLRLGYYYLCEGDREKALDSVATALDLCDTRMGRLFFLFIQKLNFD